MENFLFESDFDTSPTEGIRPQFQAAKPLSVGQVSELVRDCVSEGLPSTIRVIGQVSNFSGRQHWFFSLKDEQSTLSCVCFASAAKRVVFPVANGLQVIATGRIDYYDAQGRLQLYVEKIEPVGTGSLELQFRALCDRLRKQGYFDPANKKPLPMMPRCVAVVTSRRAAALQDVINTAERRWPGCRLMLLDVPVQGEAAASRISQAVHALSREGQRLGIDAMILTRGGGSMEDLWAFNESIVADAIFACDMPIVAAIGHETDTTIAELVADVRCATPTQAVMTLLPDQQALQQQVHQLARRLVLSLTRQYEVSYQRLRAAEQHPIFRRPGRMIELMGHRLDNLVSRLQAGLPQKIQNSCDRLESLAKHLDSVSPTHVLNRGYSYTLAPNGRVLRSVADVAMGDSITTVLADGRVASTVGEVPKLVKRKRSVLPVRRTKGQGSPQGLFDS